MTYICYITRLEFLYIHDCLLFFVTYRKLKIFYTLFTVAAYYIVQVRLTKLLRLVLEERQIRDKSGGLKLRLQRCNYKNPKYVKQLSSHFNSTN